MVPGWGVLAVRGLVPQLWDRSFLAFVVCFLVSEAGLEVSAGFLDGMAFACPLMGWAESWPSGGQDHI